MITEEVRRKFVRDIAMAFSGTDFVEERNEDAIGLAWERDDLWAGAAVNSKEAWVTFADSTAPVDSADEAIGLLSAIFADEIVAVAAYENNVWISQGLANAADLHRPPHLLVAIDPRQITRVDRIDVRSWTGALDGSRPWPAEG